MRRWIHTFASMKIAVSLLIVIAFVMACGTIVESMSGTEAAGRAVYGSVWFRVLLGLFAVNLLLSLVDAWPWARQRIGFALTHGSMLVILIGAAVTDVWKLEGHLALWEGEQSASFAAEGQGGAGAPTIDLPLPFTVRLDAFEIDYYQGTDRPAMFRSRVTVLDPGSGQSSPAVIEMNHELSYKGYKFFQSSYQQEAGRERTVLAVARDPGQPIVFVGYGLLMAGMLTVLGTRIAQRRMAMRLASGAGNTIVARAAAVAVLFLALLGPLVDDSARAATHEADGSQQAAAHQADGGVVNPHAGLGASSLDEAELGALRRLAVQHDGRIMPLDTLAREAVWQVTGKSRWDGRDPVEIVLSWAFEPEASTLEPMIPLGSSLAQAAGLASGSSSRTSFRDLVTNRAVLEAIGRARSAEQDGRPLGGIEKQAQRLEGRLNWMQGFRDGSLLRLVPNPDPGQAWSVPEGLAGVRDLLGFARSGPAARAASGALIEREILYNRICPSRLAWGVLLGATALLLLAARLHAPWLDRIAAGGLAAGVGVMTWGLATRWQIAGRIPASNMYESLLFLGWGAALFALIAAIAFRNRIILLNAASMSALTMLLADRLPIDPFIHPVPPVLAGTAWLAIHVPIIMVSYSVLALGVFIAHLRVGVEIFARRSQAISSKLNELLYWYIHIGSILLIAGILTGSIWAASSWGRYWGWDPKEVWSLVAFFAYLAILHGRLDRIVGSFGVAALSILAFWMILMTYVGVNFVLTAGLHSYGFGGSGVVTWFAIVAGIECLFLAAGAYSHRSATLRESRGAEA